MTSKTNDYDYLVKVLMVGDSGAGKTSLVSRYVDDMFNSTMVSTIGIDFKIKNIVVNNKKIKLQIWDTAGQERFRTITRAYYRGAMAVAFVFSLDNVTSFNNIKNWLNIVDQNTNHLTHKILVGNKSDLKEYSNIETVEITKLAQENNITYIETSAKNNINVDQMFDNLVVGVLNNLDNYRNDLNFTDLNKQIDIVGADSNTSDGDSCCKF